ncbi:MAG: hypothetical protein KGJ07_00220 [Patescibacteria group bacterium]|nr:hypothetical protein [Patescibacteria group bacterium]
MKTVKFSTGFLVLKDIIACQLYEVSIGRQGELITCCLSVYMRDNIRITLDFENKNNAQNAMDEIENGIKELKD